VNDLNKALADRCNARLAMNEDWLLIRIVWANAVFGIIIGSNGKVRRAAPIAKWTRHQPQEKVLRWYELHGAKWEVVRNYPSKECH